jgi:hypothetical protein
VRPDGSKLTQFGANPKGINVFDTNGKSIAYLAYLIGHNIRSTAGGPACGAHIVRPMVWCGGGRTVDRVFVGITLLGVCGISTQLAIEGDGMTTKLWVYIDLGESYVTGKVVEFIGDHCLVAIDDKKLPPHMRLMRLFSVEHLTAPAGCFFFNSKKELAHSTVKCNGEILASKKTSRGVR